MIILHNSYDAASRAFVEQHGAGHTIIDWYNGGREAWLAAGGTPYVSAFPSVIVDEPAYQNQGGTNENGAAVPSQLIPAQQTAYRCPTDMTEVQAYAAAAQKRAAGNPAPGLCLPVK